MASKPQSSGPATTSQAKQARSRKAALPSEQSAAGRAGSAGGIILEREQDSKAKSTSVAAKSTTTSSLAKDQDTAPSTGPNRPRRKPRKLNREPAAGQATTATSTSNATADATPQASTAELEALKSRVRGLEAKVEELYLVAESRGGRSPRRRGKGRKGSSSTQIPTLSTTAEPVRAEDEEADEELVRLEDELEVARRDLESFRPRTRPRTKRSTSGDTEYVEEIPRDDIGDTGEGTVDRQVTLSGSYRIPLPSSVSMKDVKTIQNGVSAAQNVAKSFLEQRRAAQAARTSTMEVSKEEGGKSWGEWFGGYSVAISRAVKNIEAEAAIENQKAATGKMANTSSGGKKAAAASGTARRPKARQGNLSSEQVHGLMS